MVFSTALALYTFYSSFLENPIPVDAPIQFAVLVFITVSLLINATRIPKKVV
jgi:hypothetical protein